MNINFELYKVFYSVAKELSFSKAATSLFISQSAVSQSIRQLEQKLDTPLFNRSTKQVSLTQDGLKLLEHIEPAIHMIQNGENYLMEMKTLARGQLHIGASDTICKHYLLDYFKKYHTLYPQIELKVTNRTSIKCVDLLKKGSVDLIVTNLPNKEITSDMEVLEIMSFKDVFIANKDRLINKQNAPNNTYSLETLSKEPILMLTKSTTTSDYLYHLFANQGLDIHPAIELGSIDLLVDLAAIDLGISFVPDFCVPSTSDLQILKTVHDIPSRKLGIVTHTKRPLTESAKKFIELLTDS